MSSAKFGVECPHPECYAMLRVSAGVKAGDYPCICKSCTVRLSWATYLQGGEKPSLALVPTFVEGGGIA